MGEIAKGDFFFFFFETIPNNIVRGKKGKIKKRVVFLTSPNDIFAGKIGLLATYGTLI